MKFETGTYKTNFISDQDSWFTVEVVKSTEKSVTFLHPHTQNETRAKIHSYDGKNFFYPLGRYSMAPQMYQSDRTAA